MWTSRFDAFVRRKEQQARDAAINGFVTVEDRSSTFEPASLGSTWTRERFDGPFYWTAGPDGRSVNLVFVQSLDGNTVAEDPATLGGGDTDHHLIYEGLSRVHADAVLAGARTVTGSEVVFSVWHPEVVRLRAALGRPRHPAQILVSASGGLRIDDELIFNVPEIPAIVITSDSGAAACRAAASARPWLHLVETGPSVDLRLALDRLFVDHGIRVVSTVGGRTMATAMIDAGLVSDVYLTTSPVQGGEAGTPFYAGGRVPMAPVLRKRGRGQESGVIFQHLRL